MTGGDSQSVSSYRANTPANNSVVGVITSGGAGGGGVSADEISLKSLPGERTSGLGLVGSAMVVTSSSSSGAPPATQRSLSPVSNMSGDELGSRRSARRRPYLDKQVRR